MLWHGRPCWTSEGSLQLYTVRVDECGLTSVSSGRAGAAVCWIIPRHLAVALWKRRIVRERGIAPPLKRTSLATRASQGYPGAFFVAAPGGPPDFQEISEHREAAQHPRRRGIAEVRFRRPAFLEVGAVGAG